MEPGAAVGGHEDLRRLYRTPSQRALDKEIDHLDDHCRDFIAHSPLVVLGTSDGSGRVDVSPKGGPAGFVRVLDERRLAVPDMAGNNRLDSFGNIVRHEGASVLFLVPGVDETLRVVGRGSICTAPDILAACPVGDMQPKVALVVRVDTAYIHCAKALRRSGVWDRDMWPSIEDMASPACMLRDHIGEPTTDQQFQAALEQSYSTSTWAMGGAL